MQLINGLAEKTAIYRVKRMEQKAKKDENYLLNEYNESVKLNPFYKIEKIISESKNKIVNIAKEDVLELQTYVWFSIYNEVIILAMMLVLAFLINILLPTSVIITSFLISRMLLKGDHLNSLNKCTIFTISYIMGFSYIAYLMIPLYINILIKVVCYAIVGFVLELLSLTKVFYKVLNKINSI